MPNQAINQVNSNPFPNQMANNSNQLNSNPFLNKLNIIPN